MAYYFTSQQLLEDRCKHVVRFSCEDDRRFCFNRASKEGFCSIHHPDYKPVARRKWSKSEADLCGEQLRELIRLLQKYFDQDDPKDWTGHVPAQFVPFIGCRACKKKPMEVL